MKPPVDSDQNGESIVQQMRLEADVLEDMTLDEAKELIANVFGGIGLPEQTGPDRELAFPLQDYIYTIVIGGAATRHRDAIYKWVYQHPGVTNIQCPNWRDTGTTIHLIHFDWARPSGPTSVANQQALDHD